MAYNGLIHTLPREIKWFIGSFVIVLAVGYCTGLLFVAQTEAVDPAGIEEAYMGNEEVEDAPVMKFKKSPREMLTIIHTHVLSMSFIFFLLGILVWITQFPVKAKLFLTIEPFVSVILTFGGIYLMWEGISWMRYIVLFSGILMTLTFAFSSVLVLYQLVSNPSRSELGR